MSTHRDTLLARAKAIVNEKHGDLAPSQAAKLAAAVADADSFKTFRNEGWSVPSDVELEWHAQHYREKLHNIRRTVPSVEDVFNHRLAEHEKVHGRAADAETRINIFRAIERLDADARLAAVQSDFKTKSISEPPPQQKEQASGPKPLHLQSNEELWAEWSRRTGQDWRQLMPSKLREIAAMLRAETAPKPTPATDKAQVYNTLGKALSPEDRISAFREQQRTAS